MPTSASGRHVVPSRTHAGAQIEFPFARPDHQCNAWRFMLSGSRRLVASWLGSFAIGLTLVLAANACSKTNNINQSSGVSVGEACRTSADACTRGTVCVLGYCREPCMGDNECARDAVCIGDTDFGCSLAWELGCSSSQPCDEPLSCDPNGAVGACRNTCKGDDDCVLNGYVCVDEVCTPGS
jgi:hypothetical protein